MSGWGAIYNITRAALQAQTQKLARLQEQASSGSRINRASDDPSGAYELLKLRAQSQQLQEYAKSLDSVSRTLDLGHSVLQQITADLNSVIEKTQQAASGTYSQQNRQIIGQEIDSILNEVVGLANTNSLGEYVFSGSKSTTASYAVQQDGQTITAVKYQGGTGNLLVGVAPGVTMPGTLVGNKILRSDQRGAAEITTRTGAVLGSGTPSLRGQADLAVTHAQTTILADPDATGLKLAAAGGTDDTALGRYDLVIDMPNHTIGFAGGPTTTFTGTETNLHVPNAAGDFLCVDVTDLDTSLAAPATVTVQSDANLSLGGGPAVAVTNFADPNLAVTDPDGGVLYVNTTGLARVGTDSVQAPGTYDIFQALILTRDALLNQNSLPEADQLALLQHGLEATQNVLSSITQGMTNLGGRLEALDTLSTSLEDLRGTADDQAGGIENADIAQVATDLARTQTLYQMCLATAAKLLSTSLLDYI
jgi:flagellin-like hook-associated protein FlgL